MPFVGFSSAFRWLRPSVDRRLTVGVDSTEYARAGVPYLEVLVGVSLEVLVGVSLGVLVGVSLWVLVGVREETISSINSLV